MVTIQRLLFYVPPDPINKEDKSCRDVKENARSRALAEAGFSLGTVKPFLHFSTVCFLYPEYTALSEGRNMHRKDPLGGAEEKREQENRLTKGGSGSG